MTPVQISDLFFKFIDNYIKERTVFIHLTKQNYSVVYTKI